MRASLWIASLAAIAALGLHSSGAPSRAADLLTVGSPAPVLDVEHWLHGESSKFKPVTKFEPGKVYIVEFWATWCGPCIASMPHLAELQNQFADKGVRLISISDEDLDTVEKFLEREVRDPKAPAEPDAQAAQPERKAEPKKQTYRELTSAYSLTADPDGSSHRDYMDAAAQNGIPTAFLVGKDSKIEWIGHPMEMEGPLNAVLADSWDREAFAKEMKAKQEAEKMIQDIFALLQKQDFDGAVALIDKAVAKEQNLQLQVLKLEVLIASEKVNDAAKHLQTLFKSVADEPETVDMIAWSVYEMAAQGRIEKGSLVDASIAATEEASEKARGEEKASLLDTLAHLVFTDGDLDRAIQLETEAVKLSGEANREFYEGFLKELRDAKNSQPKTDDAAK